jgi:hypothetical protein
VASHPDVAVVASAAFASAIHAALAIVIRHDLFLI